MPGANSGGPVLFLLGELGGLLRAKQIVVVGDPKQLPPTDFFSRSMNADLDEETDDLDDESILDSCQKTFRQRRSLKWWPTALLEFDFAPAWPRFAALAGVAALGFAVGLSDVGMALTKKSASVVVGTATSSDADLSLLVFEPDPLSAMRP